jgi:hypothetical protein
MLIVSAASEETADRQLYTGAATAAGPPKWRCRGRLTGRRGAARVRYVWGDAATVLVTAPQRVRNEYGRGVSPFGVSRAQLPIRVQWAIPEPTGFDRASPPGAPVSRFPASRVAGRAGVPQAGCFCPGTRCSERRRTTRQAPGPIGAIPQGAWVQ